MSQDHTRTRKRVIDLKPLSSVYNEMHTNYVNIALRLAFAYKYVGYTFRKI